MMIKAERMNLLSQALLIKIAEIKIDVEKKVNGNTMRKSVLNQINVRNELNHTFFSKLYAIGIVMFRKALSQGVPAWYMTLNMNQYNYQFRKALSHRSFIDNPRSGAKRTGSTASLSART